MKREYLFILITVFIAVSGLIYKSMFVSDTLNKTQNMIIENTDRHSKLKRDTVVQSNAQNIINLHNINKRDDRSYGEVIADLLKITEDILKSAKIKYDDDDIVQEQENIKNKNWPNRKESFYININFRTTYVDLIKLISIIEKHELLINIASMSYFRTRLENKGKDKNKDKSKSKNSDEFSMRTPLDVEIRLEYIKFL